MNSTVGADNNIIIYSKFHTINYTKIDIEFLEPTQNNHDIGLTFDTTINQKSI
jgi:hypothetical protein